MATEKRLIDGNALIDKLKRHRDFYINAWGSFSNMNEKDKARVDEITQCIAEVINAPTVDAVHLGAYEQCKYERDTAIERLESYGVSICENAEVAKVVHGRWITADTILGKCCTYSVCGSCHTMEYKYCPYCGAKMDGGRQKDEIGINKRSAKILQVDSNRQ